MTLDQLRIFIEVAARQHVTRTAQALNMTQSAVSAAIQSLEARHGIRLFDRVGRSIRLNQAGGVFLVEAQRVLAHTRAAEAALNDLAGLMRGELRIMASQTVGGYWLPRRLARYHEKWPGVSLHVGIANTHDVADTVEAGDAEIGIVEGLVDRPLLTAQVADMDDMIIVVAVDHPWNAARRAGSAGADIHLAASPWVIRETGSGTRLAFEDLLRRSGLELDDVDLVVALPSNEAVLGAVEAGMGATLTSRSAAAPRLRAGILIEVDFPAPSRPYYLLRHKEHYQSHAAAAFLSLLNPSDGAEASDDPTKSFLRLE